MAFATLPRHRGTLLGLSPVQQKRLKWQRSRLGHLNNISRDANSSRAPGLPVHFSRWWWNRSSSERGYMRLKEKLKSLHTRFVLVMLLGTKRCQSGIFRNLSKSGEFLVYGIELSPTS